MELSYLDWSVLIGALIAAAACLYLLTRGPSNSRLWSVTGLVAAGALLLHQRNAAANHRVIAEEELGINLAQPGMGPQGFGGGIEPGACHLDFAAQTTAVAQRNRATLRESTAIA